MRIQVRLPKIQPNEFPLPEQCPYEACSGNTFKPHGRQGETKAVRDTNHEEVTSHRYKCTTCGRTFRVYPTGVSQAQQSDRLKAIRVLLYILGISYGGAADFLCAIGLDIMKTTVYDNVQAAGVVARKRQKNELERGGQRPIIGADGTFLKVSGQQVGIEVVVDDETGELLGLGITTSESAEEIEPFIRDIAQQVEAEILVSDDLNSYKNVADNADLKHRICQNHVIRNVDKVIESIGQPSRIIHPPLMPKGVKSGYKQIEQDCQTL